MSNNNSLHDRRQSDAKIEQLEAKIVQLTDTVDSLSKSVEGLVEAWKTAKGVTAFVKWLSGVVVSIGILIALVKGVK